VYYNMLLYYNILIITKLLLFLLNDKNKELTNKENAHQKESSWQDVNHENSVDAGEMIIYI